MKKSKAEKNAETIAAIHSISVIHRAQILQLLSKNEEMHVQQIFAGLNIPQNLCSHHLGKLKDAGVVNVRKDGVFRFYRINKLGLGVLLSNFVALHATPLV